MSERSAPIDPKREVRAVAGDFSEVNHDDYGPPGVSQGLHDGKTLAFYCPGCGRFGQIGVHHPKIENSWDIMGGSPEDPTGLTLHPSINCVGCCGWHGFLVDGNFQMQPRS